MPMLPTQMGFVLAARCLSVRWKFVHNSERFIASVLLWCEDCVMRKVSRKDAKTQRNFER